MVEFLKKFENRCIKIAGVNSILNSKSLNFQSFTLVLYGVGVRCGRRRFSVLCPLMEESMVRYLISCSCSIAKCCDEFVTGGH